MLRGRSKGTVSTPEKQPLSSSIDYEEKNRRHPLHFSDSAKSILLCSAVSILLILSGQHNPLPGTDDLQPPHVYPRMLSFIVDDKSGHFTLSQINELPGNVSSSVVVKQMGSKRGQEAILDSRDYKEVNADEEEDCQLLHDWQMTARPACNLVHEFDVTSPSREDTNAKYKYLTNGYYRDVWTAVDDVGINFVFKPMRYKHAYTWRNFDRMRRDILTMDRLAGEKYILNTYAGCGTSGFFEFADGGDIENAIWPSRKKGKEAHELTQMEKLHIGK
jgi:hypothetical protein